MSLHSGEAGMYPTDKHPDAAHKRETREWWAIDDDAERVVKVLGFSCAPNNPGYWWVPELGSSMNEEYHLFTTQAAALDKHIGNLERKAAETEERLTAVRFQRAKLGVAAEVLIR